MIDIGQKVSFVPYWYKTETYTLEARKNNKFIGKVIYVDRAHKSFTVKYSVGGGVEMKETFKLSQIGTDVHVIRGGGNGS